MTAKKTVYMGIDINPGNSPLSVYKPRYSVIIIDSSRRVLYKNEESTLPRIIRLAWDYNVDAIGIDNVYELAPTEQGIARIISLLPPETKLIQVTFANGKFEPIKNIAEKQGLLPHAGGKLSPGKTAYLAAVLASMGVGGEVRLREEKTRIIISRSRGGSKGGWSQSRYQRRVNSVINRIAQKVKEALDSAGLDYDEYYRRSKGGLESAVFTVYAGREKIYGLIKPYDGRDYRIRITPLYSQKLVIGDRDLSLPQRPVIVGVDPGIYTGIAVIDISGNLLYLHSSKNLDRVRIASILSEIGNPVIIATDVNPPPETVKKLSAMFGSQLYVPQVSLSTAEKRLLADSVYPDYNDTHQRDALAAAYKAYKDLSEKFKQIETYVSKRKMNLDVDKIKESIVKGKTIAEAIEEEIERKIGFSTQVPRSEVGQPTKESQDDSCSTLIPEYRERIDYLNYIRKKLETEIARLKEEIEYTKKTQKAALARVRREVEQEIHAEKYKSKISTLEKRLASLEEENTRLKDYIKKIIRVIAGVAGRDFIIGFYVDQLTLDAVKNLEKSIGRKIPESSIIVVGGSNPFDSKTLDLLKSRSIKGIVTLENSSFKDLFEKSGIPVLEASIDSIERFGSIAILGFTELEKLEKRRLELGSTGFSQEKLDLLLKAYRNGLIEK
jgi:predicted RNase H-like nuclease (RuvC/YqgF family)